MDDLFLCYISFVGIDSDNLNIYEFYFTEEIDTFWGENFEYMPCCLVNEMIPNNKSYSEIKTIHTELKLALAKDSCCNSMQDCMDGIIALGWEDMTDYDEYPNDGRLVLPFGITLDETNELLANKSIVFD